MKFLLRIILFLFLVFSILLIAVWLWFQTENGINTARYFVVNQIESKTDNKYQIEFTNLKYSFPLAFGADKIVLIDQARKEIILQKIHVNILPSLLNFKKIIEWEASIIYPNFPAGGDALISLHGQWDFINHSINITSFKLISSLLGIEGEGGFEYEKNIVSGQLRYKFIVPEYILSSRENFFQGVVEFSGPYSSLHVHLAGSGYFFPTNKYSLHIPEIKWQGDFTTDQDSIVGTLSASSALIKMSSDITISDQKFHFKNFNLSGPNSAGMLSLVFDNRTKIITGESKINSSNLKDFKEFFPLVQKGSVEIKTIYESLKNEEHKISISANGKNLVVDNISCALASIELAIRDLQKLKISNAEVKINGFTAEGVSLKELNLNAKENGDFVFFNSNIKSLNPYPVNLAINGKMHIANEDIKITQNITGMLGKFKVSTISPLTVQIANGFAILAPNIKIGEGELNLEFILSSNDVLKGWMKLKHIPAMLKQDLLPNIFEKSTISGEVAVKGPIKSPILKSEIEINKVMMQKKSSDYANINLSANYDDNLLSIESKISSLDQLLASAEFQLPCKLSLKPFDFKLHHSLPVHGNIKLNKRGKFLALIPTPSAHRLDGYASGEIHVKGSIDLPIIDGMITLDEANYTYGPYGIVLKNISAKILGQNREILLNNLVAHDSSANIINANGKFSINPEVPFNIKIKTDKFNLINTPYVHATVSGWVAIDGNNKEALAKGRFELGPMEFKIPQQFSEDVVTLNITENVQKNAQHSAELPYKLQMDVDLIAGQRVFVTGRGVSSLLVGSLKVKSDLDNPHIYGTLRSVRGKYQEFGKVLDIKTGILSFDGPISPSPYLNIIGATFVGDEEIKLILSGSIFKPDIRIESSASGSQESALSKLLFGKNSENISNIQALVLADSMRRLSGHGGGFDPLRVGKKILHIDEINIKNSEDSDRVSVGVGKYITEKLYVEIEQGDDASGTKTRIEVELTPKLSVEAVTEQQGNSSLGLNWRFDY